MSNPWEEISLSDYENHMGLESVKQLQTLNEIMKAQFGDYNISSAIIFGVAGGNGLEHVDTKKYNKVCGVDINSEYLKIAAERYRSLDGILEFMKLDLKEEADKLPQAELIIANLLIEYIGYDVFRKCIAQVKPLYISCVIQINTDTKAWVSASPYLHTFDGLDTVHYQIEEAALTEAMNETGYNLIMRESYSLPDGKSLLRLDYNTNS